MVQALIHCPSRFQSGSGDARSKEAVRTALQGVSEWFDDHLGREQGDDLDQAWSCMLSALLLLFSFAVVLCLVRRRVCLYSWSLLSCSSSFYRFTCFSFRCFCLPSGPAPSLMNGAVTQVNVPTKRQCGRRKALYTKRTLQISHPARFENGVGSLHISRRLHTLPSGVLNRGPTCTSLCCSY